MYLNVSANIVSIVTRGKTFANMIGFPSIARDEIPMLKYLLNCDKYHPIREILFEKAVTVYPDFNILSDEENMIFLFSNHQMIRACAKACCLILKCRSVLLYK